MNVSIIIPTYNSQKTVGYCLDSCLNQIDYIKEIIIIDDHSTDATIHVIEEYRLNFPGKIQLFTNNGKGSNLARNLGFTKATGDYIQWLDSDDELGENKLKNQIEFLTKNTNYDIAYSDWRLKTVDQKNEASIEYKSENQDTDFLEKLLLDQWLPPHAYLLRFEVANMLYNNDAWNPNTSVLQDREYFTMAAILGFKFGFVGNTDVVYYRYPHINSVSKAKSQDRYTALLNLVFRIKKIIEEKGIKLNQKCLNLVTSLEFLCIIQLDQKLTSRINPFLINWSVFPGKRIKIKAISKCLFP
jgi:glycosyltransferase involved in cell wall biosynthesis